MRDKDGIFGCFIKVGFDPQLSESEFLVLANTVRSYVWGEGGLSIKLSNLKHASFGYDVEFVLLQFFVKPTASELQRIKEIESFRSKEKSIAIPIIVTDENFFNKSEAERWDFLKRSILQKLDLMSKVVRKRKLDTNLELLRAEVERVLST
jgi:hypothetical protein